MASDTAQSSGRHAGGIETVISASEGVDRERELKAALDDLSGAIESATTVLRAGSRPARASSASGNEKRDAAGFTQALRRGGMRETGYVIAGLVAAFLVAVCGLAATKGVRK